MRKFTYIDTESYWDEHLHACAVRVDPSDLRCRIGCKRIFAAAAMDISVDPSGAITCERIASWSLRDHGDEQAIVRGLFEHLYACDDRNVVGFGSLANDVQILQLAAIEYSLVLPSHFRARRGPGITPTSPGSHFDLGLGLKGPGKSWPHLTEVLARIGIPLFLYEGKKLVSYPAHDQGWADVIAHVELDCALLAIAHLAWLRSQGQQGLDCWTASLAVLDWARRHGRMTAAAYAKLELACAGLASMISDEQTLAA
ncbi:MAG: hypothetical protein MK060_18565 [Blastomonas sp.]|uniref:hypothetical protein n=1 Tax=Blastomonas sp. TaxID=1909299 RepID=UPI0010F64E8D|nr:hypothetical protein [Blastomonas sp.]